MMAYEQLSLSKKSLAQNLMSFVTCNTTGYVKHITTASGLGILRETGFV